ncbi:NAD(P)-dependent oxidoreductase [Salisediminibacterium halotolerans]|uniref:NADH-flavin reductase n=1 Tax=Salisediminibacterium halotolerans TaxID=517425 RepID=A0A1H9TJ03_9BACI|nr:NAD(P)H-binding protein [Salisediminibacterium haloalkalitolerans]SER96819.1 Putative NADH-flavin reductase [Salisediminibacterium haloalkalitolerans]
MNITVFGGTGRTGRNFVTQAIAAGHHTTALVRDLARAKSLLPDSEKLILIEGDVLDPDSVKKAITSETELVFSALSTDKQNVLSRSIGHILSRMAEATTADFAAISTAGILNARHEGGKYRFESSESKRKSTEAAKDHLTVYERLKESSINWILFCPTYIPDGPAKGPVVWEFDLLPEGVRQITPESIAAFALENICNTSFHSRRIGIGEKSEP